MIEESSKRKRSQAQIESFEKAKIKLKEKQKLAASLKMSVLEAEVVEKNSSKKAKQSGNTMIEDIEGILKKYKESKSVIS